MQKFIKPDLESDIKRLLERKKEIFLRQRNKF